MPRHRLSILGSKRRKESRKETHKTHIEEIEWLGAHRHRDVGGNGVVFRRDAVAVAGIRLWNTSSSVFLLSFFSRKGGVTALSYRIPHFSAQMEYGIRPLGGVGWNTCIPYSLARVAALFSVDAAIHLASSIE